MSNTRTVTITRARDRVDGARDDVRLYATRSTRDMATQMQLRGVLKGCVARIDDPSARRVASTANARRTRAMAWNRVCAIERGGR